MAVLADKKIVGSGFSNSVEYHSVSYDFSADGGSVADFDVLEASGGAIVELVHMYVEAAATSGGAMLVDLGKGAGGEEFFADKAVAALTVDSLHYGAVKSVSLADGEKIVMGIEGAAATAGKLKMLFAVHKK